MEAEPASWTCSLLEQLLWIERAGGDRDGLRDRRRCSTADTKCMGFGLEFDGGGGGPCQGWQRWKGRGA